MANIALIPTDLVRECWPALEPFIHKVVEDSPRMTADAYYANLTAGDMQVWTAVAEHAVIAILVTEIVNYPAGKACRLVACVGGGMKAWVRYIEDIENWARSIGCRTMEPFARRGWERVLRKWGYRPTHVILEKEL